MQLVNLELYFYCQTFIMTADTSKATFEYARSKELDITGMKHELSLKVEAILGANFEFSELEICGSAQREIDRRTAKQFILCIDS